MKRIFIVLLMGFSLLAVGLNMTIDFPELENNAYISPNKEAISFHTKIYFVYGNALRTENRKIEVKNNDYESAMINAIIVGPKNIAYKSLLVDESEIISVEYANNTCYLNLSKDILETERWQDERLDLYLWSVVNSLTEIKRVFQVQFLIDGERINRSILDYNLNAPLSRLESLNYEKERMPSDVIVEFIDNITSTRYDLAYELLSENTKQVYDFNDFVKFANSIGDETFGFTRDMYFTKTYSDHWVVYVKFLKNVENKAFQEHFFKNWTVVNDNGNYLVDLLSN
ncbi:GerMN domain-containing protein [Fusibacter paucivorans]|uniref:GerMN domain-containing protein n=1 Tax=Fusibacter paucivorans TaxID=76009 RepID=A0ABS5PPH3_9FIRM|nr:GerMN domain-containing protein [Fusibacter paucivorans]MBS7526807.1 GerMN domain-containing protein [Fusibacter paucivorans]